MITREDIEENLREIINRRKNHLLEKVPDGWMTTVQAAKVANISRRQMFFYLDAAAKSGEIKKKNFRVRVGNTIKPLPYYFVGKKLQS
jgi:hypothetical protein